MLLPTTTHYTLFYKKGQHSSGGGGGGDDDAHDTHRHTHTYAQVSPYLLPPPKRR